MMRRAASILPGCLLFTSMLLAFRGMDAQTPQGQSTVAQFQKLEDSWSVALANKDQYALENLLLPSFIDVSAAAAVRTRNQSIADVLAGLPESLVSVEQKVVNVRVVSDVAIVEGTYMLRLKEDQRVRDERGIFTHVYQRVRNSWSCVSAQRTAVVDQLEAGRGKSGGRGTTAGNAAGGVGSGASSASGEKKSDAALPFHIPLLYKGKESRNAPRGSAAPAAAAPAAPVPAAVPPSTGNPPQ